MVGLVDPHALDPKPVIASSIITKAEQEERTQGLNLAGKAKDPSVKGAQGSGQYDTAASLAKEAIELER